MSNPYYSNTGYPQFRASGKSEDMRAELKRVEEGFARLPDPIMPNQPVFGNSTGNRIVSKTPEEARELLGIDPIMPNQPVFGNSTGNRIVSKTPEEARELLGIDLGGGGFEGTDQYRWINGTLIQWMHVQDMSDTLFTVPWPIAFPNKIFVAFAEYLYDSRSTAHIKAFDKTTVTLNPSGIPHAAIIGIGA